MARDCYIRIITTAGGKVSRFYIKGGFETRSGIAEVCYTQDGDEVTLLLGARSMYMRRRGVLAAWFRPAERTRMGLFAGSSTAEIPLDTFSYVLTEHSSGYRVKLEYRLAFPQETEHYLLNISIKFISEEK